MGETAVLRIRKTGWKVAYIVVGLVVLNLVPYLVSTIAPPVAASVVGSVLALLFYSVGVRSFRGQGEAIAPPRPWWRMTARPTAGFLLGALFPLSVVSTTVRAVLAGSEVVFPSVLFQVVPLAIGAFYLNSSIRLVRNPPATAPDEVRLAKWKPIKP